MAEVEEGTGRSEVRGDLFAPRGTPDGLERLRGRGGRDGSPAVVRKDEMKRAKKVPAGGEVSAGPEVEPAAVGRRSKRGG